MGRQVGNRGQWGLLLLRGSINWISKTPVKGDSEQAKATGADVSLDVFRHVEASFCHSKRRKGGPENHGLSMHISAVFNTQRSG